MNGFRNIPNLSLSSAYFKPSTIGGFESQCSTFLHTDASGRIVTRWNGNRDGHQHGTIVGSEV